MSESQSDREPIDRLADEFVQRVRNGEQPTLADYVQRYRHLTAEIRELFPTLLVMEGLAPDMNRAMPRKTETKAPPRHGKRYPGPWAATGSSPK